MQIRTAATTLSLLFITVDARVRGSRRNVGRRELVHDTGCELARYTIKLDGDNEVSPFTPILGATANADVTIRKVDPTTVDTEYDMGCEGTKNEASSSSSSSSTSSSSKGGKGRRITSQDPAKFDYYACVQDAMFSGVVPDLLHIHEANVTTNGGVVVDFSAGLKASFMHTGCMMITKELAMEIVAEPADYYLNAHLLLPSEDDPSTSNIFSAIRGQLIQGFTGVHLNDASIEPFKMVEGSTGVASVEFFAAGTTACFSVSMMGFQPVLAHIHRGMSTENGDVAIDFSSLIVPADDHGVTSFDGCVPSNPAIVAATLLEPRNYYFNFHAGGVENGEPTDGFFMALRGNLEY